MNRHFQGKSANVLMPCKDPESNRLLKLVFVQQVETLVCISRDNYFEYSMSMVETSVFERVIEFLEVLVTEREKRQLHSECFSAL